MVWRGRFGGEIGEPFALHDRGWGMYMIEKRGIGDETLLAHQLLGVEAAIRTVETYMALTRNLPGHPVVRHIVSFDAEAARAAGRTPLGRFPRAWGASRGRRQRPGVPTARRKAPA